MKKLLYFITMLFVWVSVDAQVTEIEDIWDIKYNERPMVVDVYATWCGPCKVYSPIFNKIANEYEGVVDFYRMDVDSPYSQDFTEFNCVPTTVFIYDPKGDACIQYFTEEGLLNYQQLKSAVEKARRNHFK